MQARNQKMNMAILLIKFTSKIQKREKHRNPNEIQEVSRHYTCSIYQQVVSISDVHSGDEILDAGKRLPALHAPSHANCSNLHAVRPDVGSLLFSVAAAPASLPSSEHL